ncbi:MULTISPECIES: septum formation initiator family protein [unclassified Devosia]|uniref:FtsB family cell division protein n=1 Tax=unclassified Devosia TaxID=196773 RepID=UPI0015FC9A0D|nr:MULTISPECIES: septum formation initiator family protein [unclassified Devosia]MBJ6986234.1 septum formation initiator family protein [Devosia sp. MC521]MBK1793034.1 septum formation initiator family protein [Devosia sp. WQ 349K1]QMW64282.1 septum formation initiator family protein [Devosia sp. MC521]
MPTRLKRPPFWRHLALTAALLGVQGYLGYSAISGQFGIENRAQIIEDIQVLEDKSSALQAEIDAFKHRVQLMNPKHLDPDLITERARALLNMAHTDDILVMVNPDNGKPVSGKFQELIDSELRSIIEADSTL